MTVLERLQGCPNGATYHALRLFHSDQEIYNALKARLITSEMRHYSQPCNFIVEWFHLKVSK
jgi:hypothetical protein